MRILFDLLTMRFFEVLIVDNRLLQMRALDGPTTLTSAHDLDWPGQQSSEWLDSVLVRLHT
jgi:hypothetical protein